MKKGPLKKGPRSSDEGTAEQAKEDRRQSMIGRTSNHWSVENSAAV